MGKHIVFMGAGAVGGYVGAYLTRAGHDVALVGQWPENIDCMKKNGVRLSGSQGECVVRVKAMHVHEVQGFIRKPVDIAIICTKSYDTEWAALIVRQYLAPGGYVVSMQNSINEERIAGVVGWGRTLGCILSGVSVNLLEPGHIHRYQQPGGDMHTVFGIGEVHGRVTPRASELASVLGVVDSARVTQNLWGERWTKLTTNSIMHGVLGATGLMSTSILQERGIAQRVGIRLAAEAVVVGRAQGYHLGAVFGITPDDWCAADAGDAAALQRVGDGLFAWGKKFTQAHRSSLGRDVERGRRSEIEYTNGLVVAKGAEAGVPAPTQAAVTSIIKRIDRGDLTPDPRNIEHLLR